MATIKINTNLNELKEKVIQLEKLIEEINNFEIKTDCKSERISLKETNLQEKD